MGFSRVAALHLVPLLTRIVLCAVFVPAGWSKIMDKVEFSGPTAATILGRGDDCQRRGEN